MALLLGVDTGGTYTDAALIRDDQVIASAKSLTTRQDLAIGVGGAVRAVLEEAGVDAADVSMAALSTTLATNALGRGAGWACCADLYWFCRRRSGASWAWQRRSRVILRWSYREGTATQAQRPPRWNVTRYWPFLEAESAGVSGFAVASLFATRNPAHEQEVARIITERTGAPVTCSHELSSKLNGPKRAVTAVLNARLIGMIDRLINRAAETLADAWG